MCVFAYVPNLHHWFMYVPVSVLVIVMRVTVTKLGWDMGYGRWDLLCLLHASSSIQLRGNSISYISVFEAS